jgi:hypothetical protein
VGVTDTLFDGLEFWEPYRDWPIDENYLPWGEVARGSSADKQFRVHNMSTDYTATAVVVSVQEMGLADPTRSVAAQHLLSADARTFTATLGLDTLPPGGVSDRLTLRRVVAPDADSGQGDFQILAHATWR